MVERISDVTLKNFTEETKHCIIFILITLFLIEQNLKFEEKKWFIGYIIWLECIFMVIN